MERFDLQMFQCIIMKSKQISLKLGMQNVFTKGYVPNWSEEVFVIKKFKNTVLWTYDISNLNGEEIGIIGGVIIFTTKIWLFVTKSACKRVLRTFGRENC